MAETTHISWADYVIENDIDESMCLFIDVQTRLQLWPRCEKFPHCPCGGSQTEANDITPTTAVQR